MKRILITEKQYKNLLNLVNEQFVKYNNPEDEKDLSHDIVDTLTYLTVVFRENNINKDVFVDKIEDGVVYLDPTKYTQEEKDIIEKRLQTYVDYQKNPRDKVLTNALGFDSGFDSDWTGGDIADVEDNSDVADVEDNSDVADVEDDSDVAVIEDETEKIYKQIEACDFGRNSKGNKRKVILPPTMDIRFYQDLLKKLGANFTCQKMLFFFAWRDGESSKSTYNPFATTYRDENNEGCYYNCLKSGRGYKPTGCRTCPSGTNPGVRNYKTYSSGLDATYKTLINGRYSNVVKKLKNDNITALEIASERSELKTWGTGGLVQDILKYNNTIRVNRIEKYGGGSIVDDECVLTTAEYNFYKQHIKNKSDGDAFRGWVNSDSSRLNYVNRKLSDCSLFTGLEKTGELNDYVEIAFKHKGKEWVKLGKPGKESEDVVVDSKKDEEIRNRIIKYAETKLGQPYIWGKEFDGVGGDCSGFIDNVLRNVNGITSPYDGRETSAILKKLVLGKNVGKKSGLKKGDILVFNPRGGGKIGHVGFVHNVNSDGTVDMIHSSSSKGVIIQKDILNSGIGKRYYGAIPIVNGRYESSSTGEISSNVNVNNSRKDEDDCPNYDCWSYFGKESFWNGTSKINNKTVPKITIEKSNSLFKITYKGTSSGFLLKHSKGGKNDTIHQLLNVLTLELNDYLKTRYLKPVIKSIKMDLVGNSLTVEVPLIDSGNKKYIINRRGRLGGGSIDESGLVKYEDMDGYEEAYHTSGSLREKFITVIDTNVGYGNKNEGIEQPKKGSGITKPSDARLTSLPQSSRWGRQHHGYDIVGPYSGKKCLIVCNNPGIVTHAGRCGGYGNLVEIKHGNGKFSAYAHLYKISVTEGQQINVGDVIGIEGNTGGSMGRHLHFEERVRRPKNLKNRCGEGSPYNEVYGYDTVKPLSNLDNYFYFQQGI